METEFRDFYGLKGGQAQRLSWPLPVVHARVQCASILEAAKRGEETSVNGFGRFAVKERPAREGRNPRTGETLKIAASKSLGFKMSKPVGATL